MNNLEKFWKNGRLKSLLFFSILLTSLVLFTLPGSKVPTISWLNIPHLDKIIHNIIFFSLSTSLYIWLAAAFPPIKKKGVIVMILILVGYGIAIEFIQDNLIEGRSFEIKDILADTSGCLIFFICYLIYRRC
ncbi:MAG: hypothetical protein EAZ35_10120 [Sphingobacteriia bacterium]|nr:MAG: hypothetical protein EAZ41_07320 [Sphingobacteriia bacterium]TAG29688.1 MAG: hypothetical protein EAZ35_10120 [Sphingobacteriia bacterium]